MKILLLPTKNIKPDISDRIRENVNMNIPNTIVVMAKDNLQVPEVSYSKARQQYNSTQILNIIRSYANKKKAVSRVLGILDVDIFVSGLNFVFGQAECPGRAALISLYRLRPEFYAKPSSNKLFIARATKEAVHELGHTFGLAHCSNPFCAMYFSNSIFETDRKQDLFCSICHSKAEKTVAS